MYTHASVNFTNMKRTPFFSFVKVFQSPVDPATNVEEEQSNQINQSMHFD